MQCMRVVSQTACDAPAQASSTDGDRALYWRHSALFRYGSILNEWPPCPFDAQQPSATTLIKYGQGGRRLDEDDAAADVAPSLRHRERRPFTCLTAVLYLCDLGAAASSSLHIKLVDLIRGITAHLHQLPDNVDSSLAQGRCWRNLVQCLRTVLQASSRPSTHHLEKKRDQTSVAVRGW